MSDEQISNNNPSESEKSERSGHTEQQIRYVPVEYVHSSKHEEDEIDLLDLVETIWDGRKIILISTAFFTLWGLFHFLTGPTEYESESILIQETRSEGGQAQQLLQSLGGGNFGGGSGYEQGVLPPNLYPRIVESVEFQYGLLFEEFDFERYEMTTTLFDYFNRYYEPSFRDKFYTVAVDYTVKLPVTLYRLARGVFQRDAGSQEERIQSEVDDRIRLLSREERRALSALSGRIGVEMEGSLITVKTRMPDPQAAAQINVSLVERIQDFVTDYRIEKARQNLEFTEKQQMEAQERYEEAQRNLAQFSDQNISLATATARTEQEHLQNQRDLTYNIYNSISQQVARSRLTLQEETPVFSTLQKSNLPTSTVGGSLLIPVVFIFLGIVAGIVWIFAGKVFYAVRPRLTDRHKS